VWKEFNEHDIFVPGPHTDNFESALSVHSLTSIERLQCNDTNNSVEPSYEEIILAINALCSTAVTLAEQALGHFTRHKLKTLDNWQQCRAGEHKQLDQFHDLGMYGKPCKLPPGGILESFYAHTCNTKFDKMATVVPVIVVMDNHCCTITTHNCQDEFI